MFPIEEFRECVERIVKVFTDLEIRFHLTGGAAAVAYGDPRMTQDIDFVVDRDQLRSQLQLFFAAAPKEVFLYDERTVREAVESGRQFQMFDIEQALKMDFYPRELVEGELDRSVQGHLFQDRTLPVASRPDAAISKLIWISKGSGKSRHDLRQLMLRASAEELAIVRKHAEDRSLIELLDEVLNESDEIDF